MSNELNNIDNLFKAGLGNYSEVPPPDVWDALEQRLDNEKKRRPFAWCWFFVTVTLVAVAGSLFAWRLTGNETEIASAIREEGAVTSIQQPGAGSGTTAAGNTSAAQPATSTKTSHHKKQTSDNNTTTNTGATAATTTNDAITNNTGAATNNVIDNSAMAMAEATPHSGAARHSASKDAAIEHIINNKHQNNIAVTEVSTDSRYNSAPVNTMYATAEEEEEMLFSKSANKKEKHILNEDDNLIVAAPKKPRVAKPAVATNVYAAKAPAATRHNYGSTASSVSHSKTTPAIAAHTAGKPATNNTAAATPSAPITDVRITTPVGAGTAAATPRIKKNGTTPAAQAPVAAATPAPATQPAQVAAKPATTNANTNTTISSTTVAVATTPASKKPAKANVTAKTSATTATAASQPGQPAQAQTPVANTNTVAAATPAKPAKAHKAASQKVAKTVAATTTVAKPTVDNSSTTASTNTTPKAKHNKTAKTTTAVAVLASATGKTADKPAKVATKKTAAAKPAATTNTNTGVATIAKKQTSGSSAKKTQKPATATNAVATTNTAKKTKTRNNGNKKNTTPTAVTTPVLASSTPAITTPPVATPEPPKVIPPVTPHAVIPGTFKPDSGAKAADPAAATATADSPKTRHHYGITYGVKGGFEGGFGGSNANKFVISPYIEHQLSSKLSVMAQPAIKFARARSNALSGSQTYYKADPNGTITTIDSVLVPVIQNNQTTGYLVRINLAYSQKYDSIVKTYATGGNYIEFELPIMLKYAFNDKLSVYGGVTMTYSKYVSIKENTITVQNLIKHDTSFTIYPTAPQPVSSVMNYTGSNINSYSGPLYPTQTGGLFRMGYMLGFSYQLQKRWMVDMLMQQGRAKANVQGGYDVNKPLSTPYFRLTLGYRLSK